MSALIATVEDLLIAQAIQVMAGKVKTVEWAPPDWDLEFIKRTLIKLPGVFVIFEGAQRSDISDQSIVLDTQWSLVAVTNHVQDAKIRARGDAVMIGCYEIIETLAVAFDGFELPNLGTMMLKAWSNSMALQLEKSALMQQELNFDLRLELSRTLDPSSLVPFITYHDIFNVGQLSGAPITEDNVELEQ